MNTFKKEGASDAILRHKIRTIIGLRRLIFNPGIFADEILRKALKMSKKDNNAGGLGLPTTAMVVIGLVSGVIVGLSMIVIKYYPLPASVVPYFGFRMGFAWGAIVGGVSGLILGFLTDDKHFADAP